jgi:hypothetical protein
LHRTLLARWPNLVVPGKRTVLNIESWDDADYYEVDNYGMMMIMVMRWYDDDRHDDDDYDGDRKVSKRKKR